MGRDKALLEWRGQTLTERIAANVREAAGSVTLVGAPERYREFSFTSIEDLHAERGPMAGLEAALQSRYAAELNLVVACDLPDLAEMPALLKDLMERARQSQALCVAAQDIDERLHPLCAVYRAGSLPEVRECLREGKLRLHELFTRLRGEVWLSAGALTNVNSPEEWTAWQTK